MRGTGIDTRVLQPRLFCDCFRETFRNLSGIVLFASLVQYELMVDICYSMGLSALEGGRWGPKPLKDFGYMTKLAHCHITGKGSLASNDMQYKYQCRRICYVLRLLSHQAV